MSADEVKEKFAGKWKEVRNENLDAFLTDFGLAFLKRKVASKVTPDNEICVEGSEVTIHVKSSVKSVSNKFKLDEEVELETDNGKFKATMTYSEGVLKIEQVPCEGVKFKSVTVVRSINGDGELELASSTDKVTCKRVYKKM